MTDTSPHKPWFRLPKWGDSAKDLPPAPPPEKQPTDDQPQIPDEIPEISPDQPENHDQIQEEPRGVTIVDYKQR